MNGKRAKRLRQEAQQSTVGLPALSYEMVDHFKLHKDKDGKDIKVNHAQLVLGNCTRKIYKASKRELKHG